MVLWYLQILQKWRHCTQNNRISAQSTSEAYSDSWYLHYSSSIHSDWLTDWLKLLGCGMSVRDTWATTRVGDVPLPMHPTTLTPWLTDWSFLTVVGVSKTFAQFPCWVQMIQNIRVTKSLQIYPVLKTNQQKYGHGYSRCTEVTPVLWRDVQLFRWYYVVQREMYLQHNNYKQNLPYQ